MSSSCHVQVVPHIRMTYTLACFVTTCAFTCFVFGACAPAAMMPPPLPMMEGHKNMLGGSITGGYPNYMEATIPVSPNAQLWYIRSITPKLNVQVSAFGGYSSVYGTGVGLQYTFLEQSKFRMGLDFQLGWYYGRLSLPVAVALKPSLWLYTAPAAQLAVTGIMRLPLGLAWQNGPSTLYFESGADFFPPANGLTSIDPATYQYPYVYGSFGYGHSF